MKKCTNCNWKGEEDIQDKFCPICGDNTEAIVEQVKEKAPLNEPKNVIEKEIDGDLNGDGVFDEKDKSIAGKILRKKFTKKSKRGKR